MKTKSFITPLAAALLALLPAAAGAQGTAEDYNRAYSLRTKYSDNLVYYNRVNPKWIDGTSRFWYVRNTPEGDKYVVVDAATQKRTPLFDEAKLAALLGETTGNAGRKPDSRNLALRGCRVSTSADTVSFEYGGSYWRYVVSANRLEKTGQVQPPRGGRQRHWMEVDNEKEGRPVTSPDGRYTAYIKNSNIYVRPVAGGKERALSNDGTPGNYYSSYITWSPDSRKVAAVRIRPAEKRYVYYVESSPADQLQPKLHKQEYAKPGDELDYRRPAVFNVETGAQVLPVSDELFSSQYSLSGPRWDKDSRAITFEYNQRGHKVYRVLEMSAADGKVRTLIEEKQDKYVNYPRVWRYDLEDGRHILWASERDNYNHLYMFDRKTGKPVRQITRGEWYVRGVQRVDEQNRRIYFSANGMNKQEDPYLIHYYSIGFDGKDLRRLTPEDGWHTAWYSPDYRYLVDQYSKINAAPVTVLRSADDGKVLMQLETADISRLTANGWKAPEVFTAKGRDGKTDMWGLIYRPSNFDASKKYPVVEYIYSGPGDQYVPKKFMPYSWWMTSLAELGFIVVQVDGMTTSFRSKQFEEVCYKNLSDAGLPDHIAWIKAAAAKYNYIDTTRVGIFGCSAGGQESTGAVLFHPEFYKAAYSACGCHDNRMDKIWWNELWMGYPVDSSYVRNSNVENAYRLSRPLMLVVGEMDDNVDPASTMQVVNALIKAKKDFELVVLPGEHHTMGGDFGEHKRYDFFVRNLMGVEPPKWSLIKY